jgi:4-hydroxybenzoate polyprenyltransferase
VFLHVLAVVILALLAAWPHVNWSLWMLVVLAHACMQLSIAVLNDYCDRRLDAVSKKAKPIPLGLVAPRVALVLGILFSVGMLLLLLFINPLALLISLLYFAFGLSYNLGLKSTPLSGLVFALAIPLIPLYAFVGMGRIMPVIFWLVAVLALLGVALNLANSLPDLEDDAAHHARTLAVTLGLRYSFALCFVLILAGAVLIVVVTLLQYVSARVWLIVPTLCVFAGLFVAMLVCFGPHKPASTRKGYFYLVVLTCFVLVAGWLLGAILS